MNNYFVLVIGLMEGVAGLVYLFNGQKWFGLMWISYMFSCIFLFLAGRN